MADIKALIEIRYSSNLSNTPLTIPLNSSLLSLRMYSINFNQGKGLIMLQQR
jgi:hypothetical protein